MDAAAAAAAAGRALRRELAQVPVAALDVCEAAGGGGALVLAGEDAALAVYACGGGYGGGEALLARVAVLRGQAVRGVRAWPGGGGGRARVLVWGAAAVAVVDVAGVEAGRAPRVLGAAAAPDWVYDGAGSPWDADGAALVTAHNAVVALSCGGGGGGVRLGDAVAAAARPMLYAARLAWLSPGRVLVAAGTVFGDVVVWRCRPGDAADAAAPAVLCRLPGHEGSVYGVDISPALALPDGSTHRLVASCSDDRTLRVWDVSDADAADEAPAAPAATPTPTTGFRRRDDHDSAAVAGRLVAAAMGHLSRIWGVRLAAAAAPAPDGTLGLRVYSFGEDATAQRWRLSLPRGAAGGAPAALAHERTVARHAGKHLWAGAVLAGGRPGAAALVATGGADGSICLVREPASPSPPRDGVATVDVRRVGRFDFLSAGQILVSTTLRRLLVGSLVGGDLAWDEVEVDDDVARHVGLTCALRSVGNGAAVLGTADGVVLYFGRPRRLSRVAAVPGRVVDVGCVSAVPGLDAAADTAMVEVVVHLHGTPDSRYLALDAQTGRVARHERAAGLDARFVATSAARMGDLLLLGSRHGWLSLLARRDDGTWRPVLDVAPRGGDAITAMVPLPPRADGARASSYFVATSRDGKYRIYQVERAGDEARCDLLHETSPPLGPMIEGAWFTRDAAPELILYGFRGKHFVLWNETRREEVATVECGGAHRTFRARFDASRPGHLGFAFTRSSELAVSWGGDRPACRMLRAGTHGREIRALSTAGRYVASGAEDTTIRIWEYGGEGRGRALRPLASIKAHVTGIQRLRWVGEERLVSSGGNEEFFVWRVRRLDESCYAGLAVVREAVLGDQSAGRDLRIVDFDVGGGGGLVATLALSNSTLRTYRYDGEGGFARAGHGTYTGACLTQVRRVGAGAGAGVDGLWLVTASTDGHVALWATQGRTHVVTQAARVHQSSIKGLDMRRQGRRHVVVTGGDDNAVGVCVVGPAGDGGGLVVARRALVPSAHAAAVTGVTWLGWGGDDDDDDEDEDDEGEATVAVSVSNDQRVRAWRVGVGVGATDAAAVVVEPAGSAPSGVADAGDVAALGPGGLVLGGVGVEVWSWGGESGAIVLSRDATYGPRPGACARMCVRRRDGGSAPDAA